MKEFFKSKLNIALLGVLVILVTATAVLLFNMFGPKSLEAIDFSKFTEKEVLEWKASNKVSDDVMIINYEFDDTVEEGYVVYQSVKAGETIKDGITIVISKGVDPDKEVELPTITPTTTRQEIQEWFEKNGFTNVIYEYTLNDEVAKDTVLKLSVSGKAKRNEGIVVTVSAGDDIDDVVITVPDFSSYTKAEIDAWAKTNMVNVKYSYEMSSSFPSGKVIEQSVPAKEEIKAGSQITITISSGEGISVKDFYGKTKSEVDAWAKEKGIKVIYYNTPNDKVDKNLVVSTKPKANTLMASGETLEVYLSSGKKEEKVKVTGDHLNDTEEEFLEYIKELGLTAKKSDVKYYSTTIKKGNIYMYDDGTFDLKATINYALSAGPYAFNAGDFNDKTLQEAKDVVSNLNSLNAHVTLKTNEVETGDKKAGVVYDCASSTSGVNVTVTCKLAKGNPKPSEDPKPSENPKPTDETVNIKNYVGSKNPCGSADSCEIEGLIYKVVKREESGTYEKDIVISQTPTSGKLKKGSIVEIVVSSGIKTVWIDDKDVYNVAGLEDSKNNIQRVFASFSNLEIRTEKSIDALPEGYIISISVNGKTNYDPGNYPVNSKVVVVISEGV